MDMMTFTGILITTHINVMITLSFTAGLSASCTQTAGFVYMMELLPVSRQAVSAAVYSSWDSCFTYLIATAYFVYISTDWFWLGFFGWLG